MEEDPSAKKHINNFFEEILHVNNELDLVSPGNEEERKTLEEMKEK